MTELIRLVPEQSLGREEIKRLAAKNGWTLVDEGRDGELFELIWVPGTQQAGIHWIEDDTFQVRYVAVEGPDGEQVAASLRTELPLHTRSSLVEAAAEAEDSAELMQLLRMVGIQCAGQRADAASLDLLRRAVHDPEPLVRRTALLAASILDWPELEDLLERVRRHDDDAVVREEAAETLDIVRARIARGPSIKSEDDR